MKLRKILMGLAAVVGFTTAATAATPTVVWEGDFDTTSKVGVDGLTYTLNLQGNSFADGVVTIDQAVGATITPSAINYGKCSVLIKYSDLAAISGKKPTLATIRSAAGFDIGIAPHTAGGLDMNGFYDNNATRYGLAQNASTDNTETLVSVPAGSGYYMLTNNRDAGTTGYAGATLDTMANVGKSTKLRWANGNNLGVVSIGGTRVARASYPSWTGVKIEKVALFYGSELTAADIANFQWPSERPERPTYKSVLSLNFGEKAYNVPAGSDPYAIVGDSNWYNLDGNNVTDAKAGDAFVSYGGGGTYRNKEKVQAFLLSYVDDGSTVNISITNLTGVAYDVYLYCSSDNASGWPYKTVNGANYYALANGEATLGTDSWGNNSTLDSVLGSNVMVIRGVVPGDDGSITIASSRNGSKRGCIAAIQLGEIEQVIPKEFNLDLSESADWSSADWDPSLPEGGMTADAVATVQPTGNHTLTLDGTITINKLVVKSGEGDMLTVKKDAGATTSIGSLDVSEAADGTTWDSTEGFTACSALLTAARTGDYKFYFLGEGENGATLDYGVENGSGINGHLVFNGGTHAFTWGTAGQGYFPLSTTGTLENPTLLVTDDATLNFTMRDMCGWNGSLVTGSVVRVADGATMNLLPKDNMTMYMRGRLVLEPGSTTTYKTGNGDFKVYGGDSAASDNTMAQFYVPAPTGDGDVATFSKDAQSGKNINFGKSASAITVEDGATLAFDTPITGDQTVTKYGAGTFKLLGVASSFTGAFAVSAGTFELANDMSFGGAISVAEGATLKLTADEDYTFSTAVSGAGYVVKAGHGTLGVTPGQFGDNLVSIEDGDLDFTITHEQAVAPDGVVFCKAEEDLSESGRVFVYNAAHEPILGEFSFENNTLTFKANSVDFVQTIDGDIFWSNMVGWEDSPESTITLTNVADKATVDFNISVEAKSLKIVSTNEPAAKVTVIPYGCFLDENMAIASYDFSEALGGVQIDFDGAEAGEIPLVTGATITGYKNIAAINVPEGYGLYADASHIWLCKTANTTFANPVTGEEKTIDQAFFGTTDATWDNLANWRKAQDGLWVPATKIPGMQDGGYGPLMLDGDMTSETDVTATRLEGWDAQYALYNGMNVTVETLTKLQSNTAGRMFIWVDDTSSITFDSWGSGNSAGDISFAVAAEDGITFNMPFSKGNTINYNMADGASVNYAAGITDGTHNLTNGTLKVGGDGFTGGNLNVVGNAALVTPALSAKVNIAADTTLSLTSTAEGDLTIAGNWTNNGTLEAAGGTIVFKPGVTPGNCTENGGKVIIGQTVTINDCGKIAVTAEDPEDVRLFDIGGNPVTVTKVEGGYAYYEWDVTGKNCWWDYEFNGNLTSTGTDTAELSAEGTTPYYNEDETALRVGYGTPYRGASYPEEFTAVLYGKMVNNANHMEVGFGSTTSGTKYGVVIACGDPANDEAKLLITSGYGILETIPMKVTDPYDTDHLYAFTCQTINDGGVDKTKVSLYLDGKFLQAYTFGSKVTLGTGFQVGSIHGGNLSGATKATTANTHADLDFLRVYQTVLNAEAMKMYADEYPYTSKGGASERTFDGAGDWTVTEGTPWTVTPFEAESFPTNSALAGSVVTINATAEGEVTMNLDAATTYESLTIGEGSDLVISLTYGTFEPTITGLTDVRANVTVGYDAIKFGNIEVASGKTLTFDFDGFPFDDYYQTKTIVFTGATSGEGTITAANLPTEGVRTATFAKNTSTDQYELKITVDQTIPFVYTIAQGEEEGEWTWNGEEVTEAIVDANPGYTIQKEGDGTLTKELANRAYFVNEGLFCTTNAKNVTATITVNQNGTFDFNGSADGYVTVNLAGGKLVNNGGAMGTGSRQIEGIALTANSSVGGTGTFGMSSNQHHANVLDLGGKTLTKEGENTFFLCNTTVSNGTLNVTGGTLAVAGTADEYAKFVDASLVLAANTTLKVDGNKSLTIGAITADDATINNTGTISPFTLLGTATLAGNDGHSFGLITMKDDATLNAGILRSLGLAGAGTVNVTLTADEYEAKGTPVSVFTPEVGAVVIIGTVKDADGNVLVEGADYTVEGGIVTPLKKGGDVPEWIDPSDTTTVEKYNAWAATYDVTDPATAKQDAFLLNCANTDEAIAEAAKDFTLDIEIVDGEPVVTCPNEEGYNGTVVIYGKAALTDETWHAKTTGDQFFQAKLELIPAN